MNRRQPSYVAPSPDYEFVLLSPPDLGDLKALLRVFGDAFDDVETYQGAVPTDVYLHDLLGTRQFIALVARHGGEVIGGLAAYELEKFERDRREIYIYDLAVADAHRRRGVASGLIRALRRVARDRQVYVIFVQADKVDAPAIALYESLGLKEDVFQFDLGVND